MERRRLVEAVEAFLAVRPEALVEEISRGVKARRQSVSEVLFEDSRFVSRERRAFVSDRARVWLLASDARDASGRAAKGKEATQCDRLLAILRDGYWHSTSELMSKVPSIVHSRIAELRKKGHRIDHRHTGGGAKGSSYRLVVAVTGSSLEKATASAPTAAVAFSSDEPRLFEVAA